MFKEKILPLEQCVKVGGNKYGKPTECCGTSFPNMIPKQQVQIQKKQKFSKFSSVLTHTIISGKTVLWLPTVRLDYTSML